MDLSFLKNAASTMGKNFNSNVERMGEDDAKQFLQMSGNLFNTGQPQVSMPNIQYNPTAQPLQFQDYRTQYNYTPQPGQNLQALMQNYQSKLYGY